MRILAFNSNLGFEQQFVPVIPWHHCSALVASRRSLLLTRKVEAGGGAVLEEGGQERGEVSKGYFGVRWIEGSRKDLDER